VKGDGNMGDFGRVRIGGREFRSAVLVVRKRYVRVRGKSYPHYSVTIPREVGEWLFEAEEKYAERLPEKLRGELGGEEVLRLPALFLIGPSDWYHGLLWETFRREAWLALSENIRRELEALGLDPGGEEAVLIAARRSEVEQLGLDPAKPITLEDLKEKLLAQLGLDERKLEALKNIMKAIEPIIEPRFSLNVKAEEKKSKAIQARTHK